MKKIYESQPHTWSIDYAERVHIYEVEDEDEHQCLDNMTWAELCEYFGVPKEPHCGILPGDRWSQYFFRLTDTHIIMLEHITYNV